MCVKGLMYWSGEKEEEKAKEKESAHKSKTPRGGNKTLASNSIGTADVKMPERVLGIISHSFGCGSPKVLRHKDGVFIPVAILSARNTWQG